MTQSHAISAAAAGTFTLGGDLTVNRMGFGAMRITGSGIWRDPPDVEAAKVASRALLDNRPAVAIPVFLLPGSNALDLSRDVRATMSGADVTGIKVGGPAVVVGDGTMTP